MRTYVKNLFKRALACVLAPVVALVALAGVSFAQVPSTQPPYNVDLGALITNTARVPGTTNSAQLNNLDKTGIACTFNQTTSSGSPQVVINIQNFDAASGQYYTIANSGSAQTPVVNTPITVFAHSGAQTSSLPSGAFAFGLPLGRLWRVQQVLSGATTTMTGTVGCNVLK